MQVAIDQNFVRPVKMLVEKDYSPCSYVGRHPRVNVGIAIKNKLKDAI